MADTHASGPLALRSIYLRRSSMELSGWFDPLVPNQRLRAAFRSDSGEVKQKTVTTHHADGDETHRFIEFSTVFEFAYLTLNGEGETTDESLDESHLAAKIIAEIAVDYAIQTDTFPDQDLAKAWAESNVLLHSWPYWREFCQNAMLRMSLPVTMIPLIQIEPGPADPAARGED